MSEWNPNLYLRFREERTQPTRDLINRIRKDHADSIIDIGCGPGNSTIELKRRWKDARIIGLDNSEAMLEKARADYPDLEWINRDAGRDFSDLGTFDIVFSNAAIQWIPDHKGLLKRLFGLVADSGVLAVQVPNVTYMPIGVAIGQTAMEDPWRSRFEGMDDGLCYKDLDFYYDVLCSLTESIELWETHYYHVMPDHESIIEWYKSTGMRPYLEKLNEQERSEFTAGVLARIRKEYRVQEDGRVLFPFRRLFFIAYR